MQFFIYFSCNVIPDTSYQISIRLYYKCLRKIYTKNIQRYKLKRTQIACQISPFNYTYNTLLLQIFFIKSSRSI